MKLNFNIHMNCWRGSKYKSNNGIETYLKCQFRKQTGRFLSFHFSSLLADVEG